MADVKAPVVAAVESVVEKDNPKVTSKVSDESVKAPVVKESVKVPVVKKSVKASSVVADKPSSVVTDKVDVVKDNINVVADKVVKENVLSVVADKASNINVVAVADKASDALKNKPAGKGKKPDVGKDKDKPKNIAPDVVKEKFKPNPKQKVISSEILVLRLSKQKENPEFKAKVNVKNPRPLQPRPSFNTHTSNHLRPWDFPVQGCKQNKLKAIFPILLFGLFA
ncbi:hypothetical protein Tco_0010533 [Tanacetum coccineum]